jgi:hypothetical protein
LVEREIYLTTLIIHTIQGFSLNCSYYAFYLSSHILVVFLESKVNETKLMTIITQPKYILMT